MKMLTTAACVPLLAAFAVLPAQDKKPSGKDKAQKQEKIEDSKFTKNDPAIEAIDAFIKKQRIDKEQDGWKTRLSAPPKQEFGDDRDYFWHLDTDLGQLKIKLYTDTAPMHATSGIYLARLGFYDGLNFHRIIPGFMAQGGCPRGDGRGSPGYKYAGEFDDGRLHTKPGILSMANAGPSTDGSQFFITFGPTRGLDGKHTVWGEVVDGMETLKGLESKGIRRNNGVLGPAGPKITRTWIEVAPKKKGDDKAEKADKGKDNKGRDGV